MTPKTRGARALKAVKTYPAYDKYDLRSSIVDLIADLLHLASHKSTQKKYKDGSMDALSILDTAIEHWTVEQKEKITGMMEG